jgi:phospholipid transport system substrate-binding protein
MSLRSFALVSAGFALSFVVRAEPALADVPPADPAARQIALFDDALLDSMKAGKKLGTMGRYNRLKPVIERTFDLSAMTAETVGPSYDSMPKSDQQSLIDAFERMTIASYAHNFNSYSGERFTIAPNIAVRGDHKLVQTMFIPTGDKPHAFNYVMHEADGSWKVIDVLLEGYVSQAATKRSDFSTTVASGGANALVKRLNTISDGLLSGG